MFIGWLKPRDVARIVEISNASGWLCDGFHISLMIKYAPHLCYGAYENDRLVGAVAAIEFERSVMIKYLMVAPDFQKQGLGKRLFETLLSVLEPDYEHIYLHANPDLQGFFERYGFARRCNVARLINVGKVPPFHFTNAHAKELESTDFDKVMTRLDHETFSEVRTEFLFEEMERNSSLRFALPNGFQHSSVVNARNVYLGPWQVRCGHDDEAEKMLRGVLYFRGLRRIIADVPAQQRHVMDLYAKYHFKQDQKLVHMAVGDAPIRFENIFAFSL